MSGGARRGIGADAVPAHDDLRRSIWWLAASRWHRSVAPVESLVGGPGPSGPPTPGCTTPRRPAVPPS